jgi:hypothetical protein
MRYATQIIEAHVFYRTIKTNQITMIEREDSAIFQYIQNSGLNSRVQFLFLEIKN